MTRIWQSMPEKMRVFTLNDASFKLWCLFVTSSKMTILHKKKQEKQRANIDLTIQKI